MVYKPPNFPPGKTKKIKKYTFFLINAIFSSGPPRFPIFGSYLIMLILDRQHLHKAANKLCAFYKSNIIGLYHGKTPLVILNDTEKVKNALYNRDFDGKPDLLMGRLRDLNMDLRGKILH